MAKMLDCSLEVNKFKLYSRYRIRFRTSILGKYMDPLITCPVRN